MSDNNVCETCGGYKTIWYKVDLVMKGEPEQPVTSYQVTTTPFNLCPGHPEPAPKHDGKLDEKGDYTVEIWTGSSNNGWTTVDIDENVSSWDKDNSNHVELTPRQALSLLDWLRQEEQELQRLAKEQEG